MAKLGRSRDLLLEDALENRAQRGVAAAGGRGQHGKGRARRQGDEGSGGGAGDEEVTAIHGAVLAAEDSRGR